MDLSLRYRPRTFKTLVGQTQAKKTLRGILTGKHATPGFLFAGDFGCGKSTAARIVARQLNCSDSKDENPCLKCESCRTEKHPDIIELNASDKRGIDDVRQVIDVCRLAPTYKHRVYIWDEAHFLTPQAASCFLKLLEEPPSTVTFILVTTHPDKLLPTIRSRCQRVTFAPVNSELLAKRLVQIARKEGADWLQVDHGVKIADASMGHPRDALKTLDRVLAQGSGKKPSEIDVDKMVGEVVLDSPRVLTQKFVSAVLDEELKKAFALAKKVPDAEYFLSSVVDLLRSVLYYSVSPDLVEHYYARQVEKMREVDVDVAAALLKVFAEAYQQAKSYVLSADILLDLAIAQTFDEGDNE